MANYLTADHGRPVHVRTLAEFLEQRARWLRIDVVPAAHPERPGWDVVLRLDGCYAEREMAESVASLFRRSTNLAGTPVLTNSNTDTEEK